MDVKDLIKQIAPYLKTKNYTQKGRLFYVIQNNIAYCIEFEQPTQQAYLAYYVLPLYIPFENRCFTYGRRIPLRIPTDNAEILCKEVLKRFDKTVFPFFKKATSLENLIKLCKRRIGGNIFDCTKLDKLRLRYLTYAFLGVKGKAMHLERIYRREINAATYYTDPVKEMLLGEIEAVNRLWQMNPESVKAWYDQLIQNTLHACLGINNG